MTGDVAKTRPTEEESPVEECRKQGKILDSWRICVFGGLSGSVLAILMTKGLEIGAPILV